jgi:hypothetical protein
MATIKQATVEDLYKEPGKAELVRGKIIRSIPHGFLPGHAAGKILTSLGAYSYDGIIYPVSGA